eukprot:TRINITY_DN6417_c0_g1_i2.p1 TRINITY_DN6417_c0_g1~~TRINITY_DN6417_c0_g1_i2.p1  ORF type:complete len:164 (+),score=34.96 TRINITY_DN6417_c0_g1_i2:64-555(+)
MRLHVACNVGNLDGVRSLLDNGADANERASSGVTPLMAACVNGHTEAIAMLLDRGADVNHAKADGSTPLWRACDMGDAEMVALLLEQRADVDVNQLGRHGMTPLYIAITNWHEAIARMLFDCGADPHKTNGQLHAEGETPLDVAVGHGMDDLASLLEGVGVTK